MALYAFVATPVQYWHHHTIHAAKQTHHQTSQHDLLLQDDGSLQDVNCPVCSHKYSTYSEIEIIAFEPCSYVALTQPGAYLLSYVTSPLLLLSNKGPPAC